MSLLQLVLSVRGPVAPPCGETTPFRSSSECRYCGAPIGRILADLADETVAACALCGLAQHLGRPRINEEARLVWVPEMSQAALNVLMRRIHTGLRSLGEPLETGAQPSLAVGDRTLLYHGQQGLLERTREAEVRLGSSDPGHLADALVRLSAGAFARRDALLGGIRLLPTGRLFEGGTDIYPDIVDSWRQGGGSVLKSPAILPARIEGTT